MNKVVQFHPRKDIPADTSFMIIVEAGEEDHVNAYKLKEDNKWHCTIQTSSLDKLNAAIAKGLKELAIAKAVKRERSIYD